MSWIVYHNNRCSKSRNAVQYLTEKGIDFTTVEYMKSPLNAEELVQILSKLRMKAEDLVRKNEVIYKEEYKGREMSEFQWIEAMIEHPSLMERPIVIHGDRAVVARPLEEIDKL
ncbi:MAG: arsenate reductase (glutaredoxin) [Bacteroidetes bacterium]|nr:MAG: arsenate reductase (glutaredoxin) [Bacteroidota bacterium]